MPENPKRLLPRFSLLTALLVLTIATMGVALWQLNNSLSPLRAEVQELREQLGYLTVNNPSKVYAIQTASPQAGVFRYRVHLPNNRKFHIHLGLHEVAGRQTEQTRRDWFLDLLNKRTGSTGPITSGEFTIDVEVHQNRAADNQDQWELSYRINSAGGGKVGTRIPWLNDRRAWAIGGEVPLGQQIEIDPNDGLVLFVLREAQVAEQNGGYLTIAPDVSKDCPGLIVFITAEPAPSNSP